MTLQKYDAQDSFVIIISVKQLCRFICVETVILYTCLVNFNLKVLLFCFVIAIILYFLNVSIKLLIVFNHINLN